MMIAALSLSLCLIAQQPKAAEAAPTPAAVDLVSALEDAVSSAIARAEPSVVAIARDKSAKGEATLAVKGRNPDPLQVPDPTQVGGIDPMDRDYRSFDFGSGVVIGDRGQILTAFHVVKGASRLVVRASGRQQFQAELIAADPRSDLAVIVPREGEGIPRPRLTPIALGDALKLRKGAFLVAMGNPFNVARDGRPSASLGILANVARQIDGVDRETSRKQLRHLPTLLQLDAKLNLGMSGGAVVNMKGELVGLTTDAANVSGFDAQAGYAIPLDPLGRRIIEALREGREVEYGLVGINSDQGGTNHVGHVQAGSPADNAGLLVGDSIFEVNRTPVADFESLVAAVNSFPPGRPIALKVRRNGEILDKTLVLAKFPVDGEVIATTRPVPWRGLRVDYRSLLQNQFLGDRFDAVTKAGVVVIEVVPGSPADLAGLRQGEVIVAVGGRPVKSPEEFTKAVADQAGPVELSTDGDRRVSVK